MDGRASNGRDPVSLDWTELRDNLKRSAQDGSW